MNEQTTSTPTPPECCPVCGAAELKSNHDNELDLLVWVEYVCGAIWDIDNDWRGRPCSFAMDAALRCGATLHPTPRELAREKLVAAAVDYALSDEGTRRKGLVLFNAAIDYARTLEPQS